MKYIPIVALAAALSAGCATPSILLTNAEGEFVRCEGAGAGSPMQSIASVRCVEDAKKLGFVEAPAVVWGVKPVDMIQLPLRVAAVEVGSPAALSGVKSGDIILELDGERLTSGKRLFEILRSKKPGEFLRAQIEREGVVVETTSTLRAR